MWFLPLDIQTVCVFVAGVLTGVVFTWFFLRRCEVEGGLTPAHPEQRRASTCSAQLDVAVVSGGQRQTVGESPGCLDWRALWRALYGGPPQASPSPRSSRRKGEGAQGGASRKSAALKSSSETDTAAPRKTVLRAPAPPVVPTTHAAGAEAKLKQRYVESVRGWGRARTAVRDAVRFTNMLKPSRRLHALLRNASRQSICSDALARRGPKFLNTFAQRLWPQVALHIETLLLGTVESVINAKLPSFLQGQVAFEKISLGNVAPHFTEVDVLDSLSRNEIELRLGVELASNLEASVVALGARVRVANLKLVGEISLVFGPLMPQPPYFGGLEIYFCNPLDLDLEVGGNVIPKGLQPALCSAIGMALSRLLVLPNRIAVDLNEEDDVDKTDLQFSDPIGVLRLTILRASGLIAGDIGPFGTRSSDPYVVVSLGATQWSSPCIAKTLNPVWGEDGAGETADFPIHSASQLVRFQVYDADIASSDDLIGTRSGVELISLVDESSSWREVPIQLLDTAGQPNAGTLFVCARLLRLTESPPPSAPLGLGGPSAAYLAVKVLEVQGLPESAAYPFKVRAAVGAAEALTKGSHEGGNKSISAALEGVCVDRLQRGESPQVVAQALGLPLPQVQEVGLRLGTAELSRKEVREAVQQVVAARAASNPHFEETLQLLIADPMVAENCCCAKLQLLDKRGTVLGSADVALADILQSKQLTVSGSIELEPIGARLLGKLTLRFLDF